jgi:flavin reductase (DIM6/NTAB) family NADH-FMN oxidoreductase RutF
MFYNPEIGHNLPHDPFKAIVSPRPIGWISTIDKEKNVNLAPYSFFNAVADNPPMIMFSITGQKKKIFRQKILFKILLKQNALL